MAYQFKKIEAKWQKEWSQNKTFKAKQPDELNNNTQEPFYVLDMFPYPSGAGLHVGHPLGYIASDIYARYKRQKGFNVLHPQGYDSFGLPAEQYAIQTGQHPAKTTQTNIKRYREQLDRIGFSFDWDRAVRTSDPKYYRWTQWIFIQLFESYYDLRLDKARPILDLITEFENSGNTNIKAVCDEDTPLFTAAEWQNYTKQQKEIILLHYRLTYLAETEVNWCPALGTVLANDEIINGLSERGGHPIERKMMKQWSMRISAYAERLLSDLESLEWSESIKESQRNWIGKSTGAVIQFKVQVSKPNQGSEHIQKISAFTTRPDTIYGVSFITLAPEHELVLNITSDDRRQAVEEYIKQSAKRSERDRLSDVKTISGVFTGAYALHPLTEKPIPIWIGDYVLAGYGTGAVMAVPCGDQRDYDFAKHFDLPIPNVFKEVDISDQAHVKKENTRIANSEDLNGLPVKQAIAKAIEILENRGCGKAKINYRLRDAVFSRQRYWGEPFPVYYQNDLPQMIEDRYLPLQLPEIEKYLPTEDGDPPLGRAHVWAWDISACQVVSNENIDHKTVFPLELNTMPGWAGSSWYMFRYMETKNRDTAFASQEALDYWGNVDLYVGGSEHATGHLLYSRFWTKFLKDRGHVNVEEPFQRMINQGMILGESALVKKGKETGHFYSDDVDILEDFQKIHVEVSLVSVSNELDVEDFKKSRPEVKDAEFITNKDGKLIVSREVEKMSKSKYNVVNPDDICDEYGADALRLFEMFLGPIDQAKPWNTAGLSGVVGFLKKLWKLYHQNENFEVKEEIADKRALKVLHQTIKKVNEDIEAFSFNTSVSSFMICVNELNQLKCNNREVLEPLCVLIAPFTPHIAEEIWELLGHKNSVCYAKYPIHNDKYLVEDTKTYPISFNGKKRYTLDLNLNLSKDEIEEIVMKDERTQKHLQGRKPKKVIIVPGKIVNIVG